MATLANKPLPHRRGWGRVLVLTMSIILLGLILCGVLMQRMHDRARQQREAVEAIRKLGGSVSYGGLLPNGESPGPVWLSKRLGKDFYGTVGSARLDKTPVTDADLALLKRLPQLNALNLEGTNISNAGLVNLQDLTKLRHVVLNQTKIGDAGLVNLKAMPQLEVLSLWGTQVTDAGLAELRGMTQLSCLVLTDTAVTDAGLKEICELRQLTTLTLTDTNITDAGLLHLEGLTNLNFLAVNQLVTAQGIQKLQKALPKCRIHLPQEIPPPPVRFGPLSRVQDSVPAAG